MRGATKRAARAFRLPQFQSTLPVRGATVLGIGHHAIRLISIHAPREGSDWYFRPRSSTATLFQSTLPVRGATYYRYLTHADNPEFQSTLPVRGATLAK